MPLLFCKWRKQSVFSEWSFWCYRLWGGG
ncbi:hypothetical protein COP2_008605 [Malus domestica]